MKFQHCCRYIQLCCQYDRRSSPVCMGPKQHGSTLSTFKSPLSFNKVDRVESNSVASVYRALQFNTPVKTDVATFLLLSVRVRITCFKTWFTALNKAAVDTRLKKSIRFLPRDAMNKRGLCRHVVCVCVSITFVSCVKTNKDIFEIFSPSGSQAILVFLCQTGWRYSDGNSHNGGIECRWGTQKTQFWTNIWLRCIQVYSVISHTSREM